MNLFRRLFVLFTVLIVSSAPLSASAEVRDELRSYKKELLGRKLELEESRAEALLAALDRYDKRRKLHRQTIISSKAELEKLLASDAPEEKLKTVINRMESEREQLRNLEKKRKEEVESLLGLRQYARFLLYENELDLRVRNRRLQLKLEGMKDSGEQGGEGMPAMHP